MAKRILMISGDAAGSAALSRLLGGEYTVLSAANGEEALSVLAGRAELISAVLLDVPSSKGDVWEALRLLRGNAAYRQLPVVALLPSADGAQRLRAMELGANACVEKSAGEKLLQYALQNAAGLRDGPSPVNTLRTDALTGLPNGPAFFETAEAMLRCGGAGRYVLSCIDIENFKVINDQYGFAAGDAVLRHVADALSACMASIGGACCRYSADKFGALYPAKAKNSKAIAALHERVTAPEHAGLGIKIRVGRYLAEDLGVPVSAMFDRATLAEESIRGRYDAFVAEYADSMRTQLLHEQRLANDMNQALANGEFEPWFQPQYNHATGALIGAEALARWKKDGKYIPPADFVPVFERNGFIYELDQAIWEQVCAFLRRWLDEGWDPLPVSVNISRRDLFHPHFLETLTGLVKKYGIPYHLLRLEVTESAFAETSRQIIAKVGELIRLGFTVEIDDFGSGYSSLNTLKDVPASILKLDMKFFENTKNRQRGGNIIESVVRMARWLGMAVIAEGVEEKEQADYLKSIGCYYIQGYYYAKPMRADKYEALLAKSKREPELTRLHPLETLDHNEFWNPKSMETLIFNSYVGGACIFEYRCGKSELLRVNEQYVRELGGLIPEGVKLAESSLVRFLDAQGKKKLAAALEQAIASHKEAFCEVRLADGAHIEYLRVTVRMIAHAADRSLFYCVILNTTERHEAEQKAFDASERVKAILNNSQCGITAVVMHKNGRAKSLFVNNRFYDMLGYTKEEFAGEVADPFDCILPEDREKTAGAVRGRLGVGETLALQARAMRRDGRVICLRIDISVVKFANVKSPVLLSSYTDVTEQVEGERQRLESARRLEIIMENVNGGVSAIRIGDDGKSQFVFNNDRYYELYGYTKQQAEEARLDVMTTILPEDFPAVMEKVRRLKADRVPVVIDYRCTRRDGSLAYLRVNASMLELEGHDDIILSVVTDITETKKLSEQLSAIIDNICGGVSATASDGDRLRFTIVNDQFFKILGYETKAQYEAECPDQYARLHPDDRARIIKQFETSDGGKQRYTMEYRILRRDGAIRYIRNNISVIRLSGVEGPVRLSVANDITDLRLAQQKERDVSNRLKAIMENLHGGVTAAILHDRSNVEIVFSNDGFYEMYGYTREQFAAEQKNVLDLILPEDRAKTMEKAERVARTRGRETYEYRCRKRDGSVIWVQCANSVISIDGVGDAVLLAATTDITALRAAQQRESEAADKLSAVLNHAGNGITAMALHGEKPEFLFANDKYFEIIGYTRKEYREKTKPDLLYPVHPDDREALRAQITRLNREHGSVTAEYRVLRADKSLVWVRSVVTITRLSGVEAPVQIAVFSDITAEKEANEQLMFLNACAHDILAQPDSGLAVNKTLERLLSYFKGDRAYVIELDFDRQVSNNTYEKCAPGVTSELEKLKNIPFSVSDGWLASLQRNEFVVIGDVDALGEGETKLRELLLGQGIRALITAPLWRDGALVGYVGIDNPRRAATRLDRLRALGDYIAILLTRRDLSAKIDSDQKMMAALMDDTPGGFVRMRLTSSGTAVPVYANDGFCELVGIGHEALRGIYGEDVLAGVHPDDRDIVRDAGLRMLKDGEAQSARFRVKNGRGEYIWLTLYGRMTRDASGEAYFNVYYSDASSQMREEQKQKELLDNLPCGAALYEYDGEKLSVIHINKSYWKLVGREPSSPSGESIFNMVHPDDRDIASQEVAAAIRQKRNIEVCLRILCGNSGYCPFCIEAKIKKEENGKYLFFAAYTPTSDRNMSLQEMLPVALSTMMSSSEDLSFVLDADLHYICCSRSDAQLLGLSSERDIIGKTDYDLFDRELADKLRADSERVLKTGEPMLDRLERITAHDGRPLLVSASKYPLLDASGNVIGLYGVSRDVTAQKEKESQLELLTSSIPGGLAAYSIDDGGIRMLYFNDGFYRFSGYSREDYARIVADDPLAFVFEEDRPVIRAMLRGFVANKVDGHTNGCVYRCHTKDGGYCWMSLRTVLSKVGEDRFIVNVVQLDITEQQEEKERLRVSEELNRLAIEQSGNIITRFDVKNRTLTLPNSFNPIFVLPHVLNGMPEEQIALGRVSPDTAGAYRELFEGIVRGEASGRGTYKQNSTKGWRWLEAQYTTVFSSAGKPVSAVISFSDVTEKLEKEVVYNKWQQSLEERPEDSYTLFRCNLSKGASFDSWEGRLLQVDFDDAPHTFGERTAQYAEQCVYDEDREHYLAFLDPDTLLAAYYRGHRSFSLEYRESKQGGVLWRRLTVDLVEYPGSKDVEAYLMFEDIDEQKKADLLTLERSEHDPLTNVLNRAAFITKMGERLHDAKPGEKHALFMLDIDNFKSVNDTLGHAAGDEVLKSLTAQIGAILRHGDLLGRLGGDEFFVFLRDIPNKAAAAAKAGQICALRLTQQDGGSPVTASIGVAMIPRDGNDFDTLYKKADAALYRQKERGKNGFLFVADENEAEGRGKEGCGDTGERS